MKIKPKKQMVFVRLQGYFQWMLIVIVVGMLVQTKRVTTVVSVVQFAPRSNYPTICQRVKRTQRGNNPVQDEATVHSAR
jgi:hypothetical protein